MIIGFIAALSVPLFSGGQVFAETLTAAQEITVTAIVPPHRDIILDNAGRIVEIDSNTKEDVAPTPYHLAATPPNQIPLTPELLAAYRQLVPVGTATYGVLYKQSPLAVVSRSEAPVQSAAPGNSPRRSDLSMLFRGNFAASSITFASL